MEKRNYQKTMMKIVEFKQQQHLLTGSAVLTGFSNGGSETWN
jgi:dienelactone hydrolase